MGRGGDTPGKGGRQRAQRTDGRAEQAAGEKSALSTEFEAEL